MAVEFAIKSELVERHLANARAHRKLANESREAIKHWDSRPHDGWVVVSAMMAAHFAFVLYPELREP